MVECRFVCQLSCILHICCSNLTSHTEHSAFSLTRPLACLPPPSSKKPSSKKPRSSAKSGNPSRLCNSRAPLKTDILLAQFGNYAEVVLGDSTTDTLKGDSSPQTSVKVVSPNKKRVSPPRMGTGLSPICKSGRKLILKSIPSFPSLGGDLNNEESKNKTPAP